MSKERVSWIDCAKGVAAVLMVLGHTWFPESIKVFFYSFHMPLFFILSGYTFRFNTSGNVKAFFLKRIKPVVVYYICFASLNIVWKGMKAALSGEFALEAICKDILGIIVNIRGAEYGPGLWFLTAFIAGYIVFYFTFRKTCGSINVQIMSAIALVVCWGTYMQFIGVKLPWGLDASPLIAFMLWIGYFAREHQLMTKLLGSKCKVISLCAVFVVTFTANYFLSGRVRVDIWSNSYGNYALFVINAVMGTGLLCYIASNVTSKTLNFIGKNSVFVYGLHGIPNEVLMAVSSKLLGGVMGNPFFEFVLGIVNTCVVLCCVGIEIIVIARIQKRVCGKR